MELREKYDGWSEIFWSDFVKVGDADEKGRNIPAQSLDYDNKRVYIGDGTTNMADLLQLCYSMILTEREEKVEIDAVLGSLRRLETSAYELYQTVPEIDSIGLYPGFFVRDDVDRKGWGEDWDVVGGWSGWHGFEEDPCYSPFVSQDQVWNLNPILRELMDYGYPRACTIGQDMNDFIKNNGYTVYNPYLSWVLHYHEYLPPMDEDKVKAWERKDYRLKKFKLTEKVKRGANNWYYSGGTSACSDIFDIEPDYRHTLRTFIYRGIVWFLDRIWHSPLMGRLGVPLKQNSYYCYAATSGIWYNKNFHKRLADKFNKSLMEDDGEPFELNLAPMACEPNEIDWVALEEWLDEYPDPTREGWVDSPIRFLYAYNWYALNNK